MNWNKKNIPSIRFIGIEWDIAFILQRHIGNLSDCRLPLLR